MSKDTPFFKFDSSSWLGGAIQFTSLESKGLFIDLCAIYWETKQPIKIDTKLRVRLRCPEATLGNLIATLEELDIIQQSELGITIPFLDKLLNERQKWIKKQSEYGKLAHKSKGSLANKKEERREKKEDSRNKKEDITKKVNQKKCGSLRFTPPTLDQVSDYCLERGNGVDAVKWFNFYQSKGWMVGKNKMKDWKAAVRTWEQKKPGADSTGGWGE